MIRTCAGQPMASSISAPSRPTRRRTAITSRLPRCLPSHGRSTRRLPGSSSSLREAISLCIHGHAHRRNELERFRSVAEARRDLSRALRRVGKLESRSGLRIDRVMVAPHERCSPVATEAMRRLGFEALVIDRANPWRFRPPAEKPLAGWDLAEFVSGGLPVFRREGFGVPLEDLTLRAFLGQPLVLYGHHDDLSEGPERLAEIAARINRLGDVHWTSLGRDLPLQCSGEAVRVDPQCPDVLNQGGAAGYGWRRPGADRDASVRGGGPDACFGQRLARPLGSGKNASPGRRRFASREIDRSRWIALERRTWGSARIVTSAPPALPRRLLSEIRDRTQPVGHRALRRAA